MSFKGFSKPNTIPVPLEFFDEVLPDIGTLAELKVTLKVIQRTLGYGKALDWIALDQFETGIFTTKRGRVPEQVQIDRGVGLSRSAIKDGLEGAVGDGYLLKRVVCPHCGQAVEQHPMLRQRVHRGHEQTYTELSVPNSCPHCQAPLKGREQVFYGLHWATSTENGVATCYPVSRNGVATSYPISPQTGPNGRNGVATCYPQLTLSLKPADAGWAEAPLSLADLDRIPPEPAAGHAVDRLTPDGTGQRHDASGEATPSDPESTRHSAVDLADRLRFMYESGLQSALTNLFDEIGLRFGLTSAGLRAAWLSLTPLPERRRRVLSDMRRMQGRMDLSERERQRKIRAIVTQNIGVTIGLGLKANGTLRVVADKHDYNLIGGLVNEYGAEVVWQTACSIAGQPIEGDPLDYLRATLIHQHERQHRTIGKTSVGTGNYDDLDYASARVIPQKETT